MAFGRKRIQSVIHQSIRPLFEGLEARQLLSAGHAGLSSGNLNVTGTGADNHISVVVEKGHKHVLDVTVDGKTFHFNRDRVRKIKVSGGAGDDTIKVGSAITTPSVLDGGAGNDSIVGGGGVDTVTGDAGDDSISGGNGRDHLDGGTGNDHCDFGPKSGVPLASLPQVVQDGLTALAQGATIGNVQTFHDNGQTFYGTIVTTSGVKTRIVVASDGTPVTKGTDDHGGDGHHPEDRNGFGSVVSVDVGGNAITVLIGSEHSAPQSKTFTLSNDATIMADGAAVSLGDLGAGTWVHVVTDPGDATVATAINAIGRRAEGSVTAVDSGAGTITLDSGPAGATQTFNVDSNTIIKVNGVTAILANVGVGMEVHLALSSIDSTLVTRLQARADDHGGGDNGGNGGGGGGGDDHHPGGDH